jgi:hypothetical protein
MFIRQFTLRSLLVLVTVCAGVSLILSFAVRGQAWALGAAAFVVALVVMLLAQSLVFWLVWALSGAVEFVHRRRLAGGSTQQAVVGPTTTEP